MYYEYSYDERSVHGDFSGLFRRVPLWRRYRVSRAGFTVHGAGRCRSVGGINTSLNQSLVVGVAKMTAVVGVFFGLTVANSYGRITALWSAAIGYMLGPATLSVSENMGEIWLDEF